MYLRDSLNCICSFQVMDHSLSQAQEDESSGLFSLDTAVKLGLYNIRSGEFRDPLSGDTMPLSEATERGFIDEKAAAIVDLRTGYSYNLSEALQVGLIDSRSGKLNLRKVQELGLNIDPLFTSRGDKHSPINFEDAILSGIYDVETGRFKVKKNFIIQK